MAQEALSTNPSEQFKFHKRNHKEEESVAEYVAELKWLSTHRQFKDYLDDALRDRLVCRLRKESTQKQLLLEDKLTFTKAVETARTSSQLTSKP